MYDGKSGVFLELGYFACYLDVLRIEKYLDL